MTPSVSLSFDRTERLKSRKVIGALFKGGQSYVAYPLRVVWVPLGDETATEHPAQVAISVSKRAFKTAVARNRIKRQIREAYRLHKHEFYHGQTRCCRPSHRSDADVCWERNAAVCRY